jgi:hypothetical protein
MADMSPGKRRKLKQFDVALATRQFEIDLFWKRSLFFWGFIVAAFVAVAALEGKSRSLSIIVSGFGMVSSLGWTLANRGSKYWQEQWEKKIEKVEDKITGPLFKQEEPQQDKGNFSTTGLVGDRLFRCGALPTLRDLCPLFSSLLLHGARLWLRQNDATIKMKHPQPIHQYSSGSRMPYVKAGKQHRHIAGQRLKGPRL